jgi:hypothetical protein
MSAQDDAAEGLVGSPVEWIQDHIRRYVETDGAEGVTGRTFSVTRRCC